MFFSLENLGTVAVEPCLPWTFDKLAIVPEKCFKNKTARTAWMQNPETRYSAYSAFEGVNSNQRIKSNSGSDEGNPPLLQHGLVIDVDYPLSEEEVASAIGRMPAKPNWTERSLSDNWRLVWLFEKPVQLSSYDFAVFWLSRINEIIPYKQVAGVDEVAVVAPEKYYTAGSRWQKIHDAPIPYALLLGQLQSVSSKFNWSGQSDTVVPLDAAAVELRKKYPRFAEWDGDFVLDSTGPSFWVDGSTSPKSATVRATGIQTFSSHSTKPFFNWSELLGHEFVKTHKLEEMGKAIEGVFYDGRSFIRKNGEGNWLWEDQGGLSLHLRVNRGLSDRRAKGQNFSPVDSAVLMVKETSLVSSAGSFAGYPKGIMKYNGNRYLNIHNRDALTPAVEPAVWGPKGNFPFISSFYENFFSSPEQLDFYFAWLARFYTALYRRDPRGGQAVFVFGPPNRGKTFETTAILAPLVGGHSEAKEWLMGEDNFNSELFDHNLWTIDDGSTASNATSFHRFSEMLKRVTANKSFRSNEKFRKAGQVQWQGRVKVSGNMDPDSMRQLPNMDLSMKEKVMLFRIADVRPDGFSFPDEGEIRKLLARELAYFARFLVDYVALPQCLSNDHRYGVLEFHEKSLLSEANHSSSSGTFGEILDEWQRELFTIREPHSEQWLGTALQLHKSILQDGSLTEAMRPYSVASVSRTLSNLATKKVFDIEITGDEHRRLFRIRRDSRYPMTPRAKPVPVSESAQNKFQTV